ncbi:MAG: sulfatase [Candidatus Wallbacteria bacterium HGW-Wallbacteria-1]|jgi:hypothetical protein|uniref:Sulfatase n=1 Tax=Candidatus Wallbacteria bacterium HGW-Wallbacteria-1 TaxID=2013854 RepID=A0A2N1PTL4_9BACT|nr:MAG: sulfatase [Candidatus Wallbacteria bacterium HGW-Wallbacteria-1]
MKLTSAILEFLFYPLPSGFALFYLLVGVITRVILSLMSVQGLSSGYAVLAPVMFLGMISDMVMLILLSAPLAIVLPVLPLSLRNGIAGFVRRNSFRLFFSMAFAVLFTMVVEIAFWQEFGCRFNFIAVDYLIYTNEVVGNIWESYPMVPIFTATLFFAALSTWLFRKLLVAAEGEASEAEIVESETAGSKSLFRNGGLPRFIPALVFFLTLFVFLPLSDAVNNALGSDNRFVRNLCSNGQIRFVQAFAKNILSYEDFYLTMDESKAAALRERFRIPAQFIDGPDRNSGSPSLSESVSASAKVSFPNDSFHRTSSSMRDMNVVILLEESMSAEFLGVFGHQGGLTPNLDRLAGQSLFFSNCYATGTRTVRGMEAIVLSIPPTPGRAIVKRPLNSGMDSLGVLYRSAGYVTSFLYSGYGYFDNMNTFFEANGFHAIDRSSLKEDEISFANIWGVCDEDILARSVKEMDRTWGQGKPAFQFIMTTSNHRPYTFPEGKIDIPSLKGGRAGGVKYADYAIGKYLEQAASRPWFSKTIFVILADHCASSGGKADLPVHRYRIPMMIYSPGNIEASRVDKMCSQVDLGPTLLEIMNRPARTSFQGRNILDSGFHPRAFIGNYQNLGMVENDKLVILEPGKRSRFFRVASLSRVDSVLEPAPADKFLLDRAIMAYHGASIYYNLRARLGESSENGGGVDGKSH